MNLGMWGALKSWLTMPGLSSDPQAPDSQSPLVKSWQADLDLVRTIYGGWRELFRRREYFLPQHPKEDAQDYYIRASRPTFYNAFSRTVRALAGAPFSQPTIPIGVPPAIMDLYEDDIDNEGTSGDAFLRYVFQDALITGFSGIFVDMPTLDTPEATRADELDAGIRPYWSLVPMDQIVSFRTVVENGVPLLAQLVFCEYAEEPVGDYGVKVKQRYRVYRRTPGDPAVVTFDVLEKSSDAGKWTRVNAGTLPAVTEIPLAQVYTDRRGFMDAKPPLLDLANVNFLHYQMWSDLAHAAHIANVPVLFGVGIDEEELQIGPNRALLVKSGDQNTTLRWLETTGASLGSTRALLSDLEEQMAHLGLGMLQRKSRAAETAEKASLDRKDQESTLGAAVSDLENGVEQALFWTAQYMGLPEGGTLKFSRQFDMEPMAADRTENQGSPQDPREPMRPGETNNPRTSMMGE